MNRAQLMLELRNLHVIRNNRVSTKAQIILLKNLNVQQRLVEYTSFLRYNASIIERLLVVQQNIETQPTCKTCGGIVVMRKNGRYRGTFPTYCSTQCFCKDEQVKEKRKTTNVQRYGNPYYIASSHCKEKLLNS